MPVRSLRSSVLRWPDREEVLGAVRSWAADIAARRPAVRRVGVFGSYASRGWGVGSDVDLVLIVEASDQEFTRRPLAYDASGLPVPADVLVYTEQEWRAATADPTSPKARLEPLWVFPAA